MLNLILVTTLLTAPTVPEDGYLYRMVLVRAAPGRLLELIESYEQNSAVFWPGEPMMARHSQGDQWDLLLMMPMGSFEDYYGSTISDDPALATALTKIRLLSSWQEEVFVYGPELESVQRSFDGFSFYHIEMFVSLAGKYDELLEQRRMENRYSTTVRRPANLVFTRVGGGAWEIITIGFYRDIQHFAEGSPMSDEEKNAAARLSGFEATNRIGTYLRSLISYHRDTLAGAVR